MPNIEDLMDLPRFCIGQTTNPLLELPFRPWSDNMVTQIYDMMGHIGITPVIAHIERYEKTQRKELVLAVLSLGVPIQISAETLLHPFSRGRTLRLLRDGQAHLIASDSRNTEERKPNMEPAITLIRKKLGDEFVRGMEQLTDSLSSI